MLFVVLPLLVIRKADAARFGHSRQTPTSFALREAEVENATSVIEACLEKEFPEERGLDRAENK